MSNILFQEIRPSESGIDYTGITWGGAWGDVNGDGYPDIWLNNHFNKPTFYLNQGNGTFKDVTAQWFMEFPKGDFHGAAWADFDNDGDQDLVQSLGAQHGIGSRPKKLYVNENGKLEDQASLRGLDYPLARGRGVLWLDYNNDGLLDLIIGTELRNDDSDAPPKLFEQQTDGTFQDVSNLVGFELSKSPYFILSDLSGDGHLELIASRTTPFTVYDISSTPFLDITSEMMPSPIAAYDIASADFNGDLLPDLYLTQPAQEGNELYQSDSDSFVVKLSVNANEKATQFKTLEEVTFDIDSLGCPFCIPLEEVYIGSTGIHPTTWQFTLSAQNAETEGIFPHTPGVDRGIYLGYDSDSNYWSVILSSPNRNQINAMIDASTTITDLTAIGFNAEPQLVQDQLLINTGQGLINNSNKAGINGISTGSNSVATGDFDNDMDEDIYIVTTRSVVNTPNILYENQGDGTFVALPDAGGAAGTTLGIGDFVITADYDLDGFLDLLVSNGFGTKTLTNNAPYQLFRNASNDNHWLQIDLEGVISNRDGIGAQLFLTANGITQLRQQDGGVHGMVQDHQRIHFGLGDNTQANSLTIRWSSGIVQRIVNIAADQIIKIKEPTINKTIWAGSSKQDFLLGTAENDLIKGFGNSDTLRGEEGDDTLKGGKGSNFLSGGKGHDILIGGGDSELLSGDEGNDLLRGNKGDDTLIGSEGNDTLKGGAGLDQFTLASYNNLAQLPDFRPGDDVIAISASGFGGNLTVGETPPLQLGSAADEPNDRLIYNQGTGELFFDQDGNAMAFSQVTIAILSKQPSLSSGDFIII